MKLSWDKKRLILVNKFVVHLYNINQMTDIEYVSDIIGEYETMDIVISQSLKYIFFGDGYFRVMRIKNFD